MIRINLLPVKQAKKREYGRQQLVLFCFLVALEVIVLFFVYNAKSDELSNIERAVAETQAQIQQVEDLDSRIVSLESQRNSLINVRRMLENLQANRIGPGGVMEELKYIVNMWNSDRERAEQETRGWDSGVDPRNVWLDTIAINPSSFRLRGVARGGEDVAEFLLRLESNRPGEDPFFLRPVLSSYSRTSDAYFGEVMQFSISGGIRYHPMALGTN